MVTIISTSKISILILANFRFPSNTTFRKFDIGIYTVITSVLPLRVYIYEGDVLLRFCPKDYKPFDADDVDKYVVGDDYTPLWEVNGPITTNAKKY